MVWQRLPVLSLPLLLVLTACSSSDDSDLGNPGGDGGLADTGTDDAGPSPDGGLPDAGDNGGGPQSIIFLHTNDEHSHFLGIGPNSDDFDPPSNLESIKGGLKRRAALLSQLETAATRPPYNSPVVVVGAGDLSMGTLFGVANLRLGPDYIAASTLQYDVLTLGNHEFDFGPTLLANMLANGFLDPLSQATSPLQIPVVTSNIRFSMSSTADDALAALYGEGAGRPLRRTFTRQFGNVTVGFVGVMGLDAALVSPFRQPVQFSLAVNSVACTSDAQCPQSVCVPPADNPTATSGFCAVDPTGSAAANFPALAADIAGAVRDLREEGVDLVVAVSHAGIDEREVASLQMMGMGLEQAETSEELVLAREVDARLGGMPGINLIIGGHSHTALEAPLVVPNTRSGINTYVVQAGSNGQWIGKVRLTRENRSQSWALDTEYSGLAEVNGTTPTSQLSTLTSAILDGITTIIMEGLESEGIAVPNDGFIFPGEQCDRFPDGRFVGLGRCSDLIPNTNGFTTCHLNQQLDFSLCEFVIPGESVCGDGTAEAPEQCDTEDLPAEDCTGLGYPSGQLACAANCTYDVSGCIPNKPSLLEAALNFKRPDDEEPIVFGKRGSLFFHEVATATFSVGNRNVSNESNLLNLVADADRFSTNTFVPDRAKDPVRVAIVANGVVRDGLFIGLGPTLSTADLFRVVPLGLSPQEGTPGFPLVDFYITAEELKRAFEVGLGLGTTSDSFWLGVSGARIEYDPSRTPFDQVTKIELVALTETDATADTTAAYDAPLYDVNTGGFTDPDVLVRISSNTYVTLFSSGLGFCPRQDDGSPYPHCAPCTNNTQCTEPGSSCDLASNHCSGGSPVAFSVRTLVPLDENANVEQELKEFLALLSYVRRFPNRSLSPAYQGPVPRRLCCVGASCPGDGSRSCP